MIKITSKLLSEIMLENFNKKSTYVGRLADSARGLSKPIKFVFFEWDEFGNQKSVVFIQEAHILQLIKQKNV